MNLNERIQKIIEHFSLSASEFADEIGVQRSNISHILSGRNKPSLDFIMKTKKRFPELQWDWIIDGKGEMTATHSPTPHISESKINTETDEDNDIPNLFSIINENSISNVEKKIEKSNPRELNITASDINIEEINDSQPLENNNILQKIESIDNQHNKIKKIVFFYENGKFEIFEP